MARTDWTTLKPEDVFIKRSMKEIEEQAVKDDINKPSHYRIYPDGLEAIDIIKKTLTPEQYKGYLIGNSLKYRLRAGYKNNTEEDIAKAKKYEEWLNEYK